MKYKVTISIILLLYFISVCGAERFRPTGLAPHLDIRQMGMGGVTVAVGGNTHALFYNPALLSNQTFKLDIMPLHGSIDDDIIDVVSFIDEHADEFEHFNELSPQQQSEFIQESARFDNKWVSLLYTPYLAFTIKGFGVGWYNVIHADVKVDQGVFVPAVAVRGYQDNVLALGYGSHLTKWGHQFDLGASVRFVSRRNIETIRVSAFDTDRLAEVFTTTFEELEDTSSGVAFDIGGLYEYHGIDFGLTVQDLLQSYENGIKPVVKVGAFGYSPEGLIPIPVEIGMDISDLLNRQGVGLMQRINFGAEVNFLANILKLRGGFHQGYPTFGFGIRLLFIKADYAYFTRELGTRPGQFGESLHSAQIALTW